MKKRTKKTVGSTVTDYCLNGSNIVAEITGGVQTDYYYDAETGFCSLQSRYYDPEIGRFINADDTDVLGVEQDSLLQFNLFAYCLNNPGSVGKIVSWVRNLFK